MMLLDRRRRPCFWTVGDNRCGPSISGEKEMALGTSREDLEVSVASVTEEKSGDGKRSVGMKWRRRHPADRLSRSVTGQSCFPPAPCVRDLVFVSVCASPIRCWGSPEVPAGVHSRDSPVLGKKEIRGMGMGQARAMLSQAPAEQRD